MPRGNVRVSITSDPRGLERGNLRAERSMEKLGKTGSHHLGNLAKAAAAAGTAYLGIAEAKSAISTTEELAKSTLKLNRNLGLSVKTSSEFAAVLKARNIDQKQGAQTLGILSKQIVGLSAGTKSATDTFKALGLTQKELTGQNFETVLGKVSDGLNAMPAGAEKTATAMKLFGRGWQTLLPVLGGGSKEMRDQLALADKYGATFGGKTVASMKEFIAKQREAKLAGIGLQVAFGTQVAPALTKFIGVVAQGANSIRKSWPQVTATFNQVKAAVTDFVHRNSADIRAFGAVVSKVFKVVVTAAEAVWPAVRQTLQGLTIGIRGVVRVISAILRGDFGKAWDGVKDIFSGGVKAAIGVMRIATTPTRLAAKGIANAVKAGFTGIVGWAGHLGHDIINAIVNAIKSSPGAIVDAVKSIIPGPVRKALDKAGGLVSSLNPFGATGGLVAGSFAAGDIHNVRVAGEEVILNPKQQGMVDRGMPIMAALKATGAKMIGNGTRAASGAYGKIVAAANAIDSRHYPYLWGGGHNSSFSGPYDCSGAWSAILHSAGLLSSPLVSGQFANWGDPGPGKVTLYANSGHVYGKIGSNWWGTSRSNPGGGAGWFPGAPRAGFAVRHVPEKFLTGSGGGSGDGKDTGVPKKRPSHLAISTEGRPDHSTYFGGNVPAGAAGLPSFTDTGGGEVVSGEVVGDDQSAVIEALNVLIAQQQQAIAMQAQQTANVQRVLNFSQAQYGQLFAGFVASISGDIGGRIGLGFMSPSTAGRLASY
jgi:hypothetical protein